MATKATTDLLTPDQAGAILGVGAHEVRRLIRAGRLKAEPFGRQWMIRRGDLDRIKYGQPGRPKLVCSNKMR